MRRLFANRRFLAGLSVAVLALTLWAVAALALHQDPREAQALRTPGAVVGVTYGGDPLYLGANWQKLLLRINPSLQRFVGGGVLWGLWPSSPGLFKETATGLDRLRRGALTGFQVGHKPPIVVIVTI